MNLKTLVMIGVVLVVGMAVAETGKQQAQSSGSLFLLLLYEDASFQNAGSHVAEYTAWARELAKAGQLEAGEKLKNDGVMLTSEGERPAAFKDQMTKAPGGVAGYFVVRAADRAGAMKIASTCPHLKYGGRILIRELDRGPKQSQ